MLFFDYAVHKAKVEQVEELWVIGNLVFCSLRYKPAARKGDSTESGMFQPFQELFLPHYSHPADHKIWIDLQDFLDFRVNFTLVSKVAIANPNKIQFGIKLVEYRDRPLHFFLFASNDVDALAVYFRIAKQFRSKRCHIETASLDMFAVEQMDGNGQEFAINKNSIKF